MYLVTANGISKEVYHDLDLNTKRAGVRSNDSWQKEFLILKLRAKPTSSRRMKRPRYSELQFSSYDGYTQYETYCNFINGILFTIRNGGKDYCFNKSQIEDLLKYERNRLVANWLPDDQCYEVSLKF